MTVMTVLERNGCQQHQGKHVSSKVGFGTYPSVSGIKYYCTIPVLGEIHIGWNIEYWPQPLQTRTMYLELTCTGHW